MKNFIFGTKDSWIVTMLTILALIVAMFFGASVYGLAITGCELVPIQWYLVEAGMGFVLLINLIIQIGSLYNHK